MREDYQPLASGGAPQATASQELPRTAFLEFGSTSIKLYLVGVAGPSAGQVEKEVKVAWDLGYDVFMHSRISPRTVSRCVDVLRGLQGDFPDLSFEAVTAVGTSALREAQNSEVLLRVLWEELRLRVHIIEGGIEAFLLETGFRDSIESYPTGLFDLGGGSLELVEYLSPYATKKTSLPVGAIRLHCAIRHARDLFGYIEEGRARVRETLRTHLAGGTPPYEHLIGTGGTVRAIVQIVGREEFTAEDLRSVLQREIHGPVHDGILAHRRKLILPGIVAIEGLFAILGLREVRYRTASVKRGLLTLMSLLPPAEPGAR
jgi:exopolyphosphatase/pppGpp-phosphohydrolase